MTDRQLRAEYMRKIRNLTREGHSATEIAVRLGISSRTVARYRRELQAKEQEH